MLTPGSVKAGDKVVHEWGNRVKERQIVRVEKVTSEGGMVAAGNTIHHGAGFIVLEKGACFTPDGIPIQYSQFVTNELHPLMAEQ